MPLNLDKCIEQLMRHEVLSESAIKEICASLRKILVNESNVEQLKSPLTIVGDIQGQYFDLLEIFKVGGKIPDTNFLFLGNYVGRACLCVETISLLACLKLRYPDRITILRGNQESRQMTLVYGFYGECMRKYGNPNVWRYFTAMFDFLPVSATIDNKFFAVHAGLSPTAFTLDQIRILDRFREIPQQGSTVDLLSSVPDQEKEGFNPSSRGPGFTFGGDIVNKFLHTNNIDHIVRSHQLCMDGYQVLFSNKLTTIWAAPNFFNRCANVGCILEISETLEKVFNPFIAAPESQSAISATKDIPDYFS